MIFVLLLLLSGVFSECTADNECGGDGGVCDVTISGKRYCSKCAGSDAKARVPINGKCRLLSLSRSICQVPLSNDPNPGTCTGCIRDFLFYRGGCYRTAALINAICKEKHIIEEGMYCGACGIEGDVPINGVCVAAGAESSGNTCDKGVCTACTAGYFFHYGSCYKFGESPGSIVCPNQSDTTGSVCGSCGPKFVKNPNASSSATSCLACYGLDGTLFCDECRISVLTGEGAKPTLCTRCKSGHVPIDGRCVSAYSATAALAGCSDVSTRGLCETCSSGYMLFYGSCYSVDGPIAQAICATENQIYLGGRVFCRQCAQTDHYPIDGLCIADKGSHTCADGVCTACDTSKTTPLDNSKVFLFYGGCYNASSAIGSLICLDASNGACSTCNTTGTSNVIANPSSADGQPKCLACWDGAATGVANCGGCAATTEGDSKIVCSKCTDSTEPKDNACPQALPPATPEGCAVQGCQACSKDSATACDACLPPLVMKEDRTKCFGSCLALGPGYYNNSGTCSPCMEHCLLCADGATCSQCDEGYYLALSSTNPPQGTCRACAAGCSACNDGTDTGCTACLPGYYIASESKANRAAKCVLCNTTEGGYTGIPNCVACFSTVGNNGAKNVVCSQCEEGYVKKHDGSQTICEPPTPECNVAMCSVCADNSPDRCEHCTTGAYLCPRTAACTKDCASCGGSMYPDGDLGECQPCDIPSCRVCATGLKCKSCAENAVPISPDVYHTACMGCSDTGGMDGWVGLAGCTTCELTDRGGGSVNCLDPGYYRRGGLGGGAIAAIVIAVLLALAVAGFLVWWFVFRRGRSSRRGGAKYTSLVRGESYDYRQSLI
ncbi:High cysteine membrane protein Group 3 [Giardia lamblia P15]|uniref:High cysteine membrane protein Group 3 n=1 Tax=Giardia intestinalis (strain P15) TaxID=658858 RepID=E1F4N8_GIAIA|nr:High cysteine membrane protein Group 3 [Giardia lamblia P15]